MSKQKDDGGPAFPMGIAHHDGVSVTTDEQTDKTGMTLRDWFAGQALNAVNPEDLYFGTVEKSHNPWPNVAENCYKAADAMLAARKEPTDE